MLPTEFDVTGKVVLVTGAGRGIGSGIAEVMAEAGATVALNAYQGSSDADGFFRIVAPTYRSIDPVTGQAGAWLERFPLLCGHTYQALVEEPNTDEPTYSNLLEVPGC